MVSAAKSETVCPERAQKRLRSPFLLDPMQAGAVLFFHLFCRMNSAAKVCDLRKFLLDSL